MPSVKGIGWRRRVAAAGGALAVFAGLPALLVVVCRVRFGSGSPLAGMDPPWRWTRRGLSVWWHALGTGLRTTDQLVDLFVRVAVIVAWLCVVVLAVIVVRESVYIARHGMPSAIAPDAGRLVRLGRWLAVGLLTVMPSVSAPGLLRAAPAMERMPAPVLVAEHADVPAAPVAADVHLVRPGESLWSIAEQYAVPGHVDELAAEIVAANAGRTMADGQRFVTAALIESGWDLHLPQHSEHRHVVVAGESYWRIATGELRSTLGREPRPGEVKRLTDRLVEHNAPRLGHRKRTLLRPGDVVELPGHDTRHDTGHEIVVDVPGGELDLSGISFPAPASAPPSSPTTPPSTLVPAEVPTPSIAAPGPVVTAPRSADTTPDTTADTAAPAFLPATAPADDRAALAWVLGAGVLAAAGVLGRVDQRRRAAMRERARERIIAAPQPAAPAVERALRGQDRREQVARIDLALRAAAADLADQAAYVTAVILGRRGEVTLLLDAPATPIAAWWSVDVARPSWTMPGRVDLLELIEPARASLQPCPMLVPLGACDEGELFVDLEAFGALHVAGLPGLTRSIAASLALSPLADPVQVVTSGFALSLDEDRLSAAEGPAEVLALVDQRAAQIDAVLDEDDLFVARARRRAVEDVDPLAAIVLDCPVDELASFVHRCRAHRGVAVVSAGAQPAAAPASVHPTDDGAALLEPLGIRFQPLGAPGEDAIEATLALLEPQLVDAVEPPAELPCTEWALMIRVLGEPEVVDREGRRVPFERAKSLELLVWMAHHREGATRGLARAALWDGEVRDATFANVVSEARRATARLVEPPPGEEWIERTLSERLALHPRLVTDAEVLAGAHAAWSRGEDPTGSVLEQALDTVRALPFSGVAYLWPDGEGTTTSLTMLVVAAASDLAAQRLAEGDAPGVFAATQQGLRVLPGHEELVALRMRAHAAQGDLSGVRAEWQSYERALRADSWSADEPSPKLVELRSRLLDPALAGS